MPIQQFDTGIEKLGQTAQSFGETVGGFLKERLHKKQFEDFMSGPSKDFQDHMKEASDLLLDEDNPEAPAQGVAMLKGALQTYMDEGARYGDNPLVQQRVKDTWKMNMDFLNMEFKMKFDAAKNQRASAAASRNEELHQAKLNKLKGETEKLGAETKKIGAEAGAKGQEGVPSLFSGPPGSLVPSNEMEDRPGMMWTRIETAIDRPSSEAERKAIDAGMTDIKTQMAQQELATKVGRGEKKTVPGLIEGSTTTAPWDIHSQTDLEAVAATIDPTEVKNRFILRKAKEEATAHGVDPNVFDQRYATIVDPTKASAFSPLKTPVKEETVGKIMFGIGGWSALADPTTKTTPKSMKEAATRLPPTLDELSGPVAKVFSDVAKLSAGDKSLKTVSDVANRLAREGRRQAALIIGAGAPNKALDPGLIENRLQAGELVDAMAEKYANEIAIKLGIVKPPKKEGTSDKQLAEGPFGTAFKRLGQAANVAGGVLRPIKKAYKEYTED